LDVRAEQELGAPAFAEVSFGVAEKRGREDLPVSQFNAFDGVALKRSAPQRDRAL